MAKKSRNNGGIQSRRAREKRAIERSQQQQLDERDTEIVSVNGHTAVETAVVSDSPDAEVIFTYSFNWEGKDGESMLRPVLIRDEETLYKSGEQVTPLQASLINLALMGNEEHWLFQAALDRLTPGQIFDAASEIIQRIHPHGRERE